MHTYLNLVCIFKYSYSFRFKYKYIVKEYNFEKEQFKDSQDILEEFE